MGISHPVPSSDRRAAVGKKTTLSSCLIRVRLLFFLGELSLLEDEGGLPAIFTLLLLVLLVVVLLRDGVNADTDDSSLHVSNSSATDTAVFMARCIMVLLSLVVLKF
jgi:hypothetical protein